MILKVYFQPTQSVCWLKVQFSVFLRAKDLLTKQQPIPGKGGIQGSQPRDLTLLQG